MSSLSKESPCIVAKIRMRTATDAKPFLSKKKNWSAALPVSASLKTLTIVSFYAHLESGFTLFLTELLQLLLFFFELLKLLQHPKKKKFRKKRH
jgi:hypothetical protein